MNITYVYESRSFWDSERKTSRAKRKLIGKIDEKTGMIVPTSGRRKKKTQDDDGIDPSFESKTIDSNKGSSSAVSYQEAADRIEQLENMVSALQQSNQDLTSKIDQASSLLESAVSILKR